MKEQSKILIVFVALAILIGITTILGITVIQLKDDIAKLKESPSYLAIENKSWHMVILVEKLSIYRSGLFEIKGTQSYLRWFMQGGKPLNEDEYEPNCLADININICFENGTVFTSRGSSGQFGSFSCPISFNLTYKGKYYLDIVEADNMASTYLVSVWDYF